jgi:choline dehydrogenase-like flavoprotein
MALSSKERLLLERIAFALIPEGKFFPAGGKQDVERIEGVAKNNRGLEIALRIALLLIRWIAWLTNFKPLIRLPPEKIASLFSSLRNGFLPLRVIADIIVEPIKVAHFSDEEIHRRIGCVWDKSARNAPLPPFFSRLKRPEDLAEKGVIECEVVVVGTGAGGAVVAKELAEKGFATVIIEEGAYYTRRDFNGKAVECLERFYREKGRVVGIGNTIIPIPSGQLVGGSTAINTGTCWRTPEWVCDHWVKEWKIPGLSRKELDPYFDRVEAILGVAPTSEKVLGGITEVFRRGCERLGYHHFPLIRNAPDCDGQGVCDFGCPTDARRSTNISYIPLTIRSGAELLTETRATRVLLEGGKAVGIEILDRRTDRRYLIRSQAVVLACNALMTPCLLLSQGIANRSGMVGKNLTIHPSVQVAGLFDTIEIAPHRHVPQGYCVDTFHREGILLLHAGLSLDIGGVGIPFVGERFSEIMSGFNHTAWFGVMAEDPPSGWVRPLRGKPFIFYWLRRITQERLKRGVEILAEIFLEAGAREVYPLVRGFERIRNYDELERFRRTRFQPYDYRIIGFHPLGTCRMGVDPRSSVVSPTHETYDIKNLFIADGSVIPTATAVNPQETIMAFATRCAEFVANAL